MNPLFGSCLGVLYLEAKMCALRAYECIAVVFKTSVAIGPLHASWVERPALLTMHGIKTLAGGIQLSELEGCCGLPHIAIRCGLLRNVTFAHSWIPTENGLLRYHSQASTCLDSAG